MMKNNERKTQMKELMLFFQDDYTRIEKHLEKKAKQGWLLESTGKFFWVYRRIEPADIRFQVTYYPDASMFDAKPSLKEEEFEDFCEHTGWKQAGSFPSFKMKIFYNARENPVPLETDPVLALQTLHKAMLRNTILSNAILILLSLLQLFTQLVNFLRRPAEWLADGFTQTMVLMFLVMLVYFAWDTGSYFFWRRKALNKAKLGIFPESRRQAGRRAAVLIILLVIWLGGFFTFSGSQSMAGITSVALFMTIGMIALVSLVTMGLKKAGASRGVNRGLTFAAAILLSFFMTAGLTMAILLPRLLAPEAAAGNNTDKPLIAAITELPPAFTYKEEADAQKSLFVSFRRMDDRVTRLKAGESAPELSCEIADIKVPFLLDFCRDTYLKKGDDRGDGRVPEGHKTYYKKTDPAPWGADEAYQLTRQDTGTAENYLLRYGSRLVALRFYDFTPDISAMRKAGAILAAK